MIISNGVKGRDDVIAFERKRGCILGWNGLRPQAITVRKRCYKVPIYTFPLRLGSLISQKPLLLSSYSLDSILGLSPGLALFGQCANLQNSTMLLRCQWGYNQWQPVCPAASIWGALSRISIVSGGFLPCKAMVCSPAVGNVHVELASLKIKASQARARAP